MTEHAFNVHFTLRDLRLIAFASFKDESFIASVELPPFGEPVPATADKKVCELAKALETARRAAARALLAQIRDRFNAVPVACTTDPWILEALQ